MRAVLGIGNPGKKYEDTRHNIGFKILDNFVDKHKLFFKASKGEFYIAGSEFNASPFFLVKPTTYVNLSGIAAKEILESFNVKLEDLLIIADDINLQTGKLRIRKSGGDGGHNGIASIIYHVESNQFPRLRFGIGNDFEKGEMANFVLDKFSNEDVKIINPAINSAIETIEHFIEGGYNTALNFFSKINQQSNNISKTTNNEGN
ncbi:MAG: aminoacyl-tRNA hydrolase [Ignavibacteria bacterium GWB2_35_6b]|nr:MAG: aminoacyl-tRNA hydrolase [Ignavibacteria bacterium GWB2_35_6b]